MLIDGKQMHIRCEKGDVGRYVILPGDPGRVEKIAAYLENARKIAQNREYTVYTGALSGTAVSVCSTGIGGPSAAIALEELVECGADTFIRVGTSGGIVDKVCGGDVVIATASVRQEGTGLEYMPVEFPACADFEVTRALVDAADALGLRRHVGVIQSKDSFYGEIRPNAQPVAPMLTAKWQAWKAAGVLTSEMESAALFVVSSVLGARCGAVLNVLWNADNDDAPNVPPDAAERGIRTAVLALKTLIARDLAGTSAGI